jgi:hypothetical protein
LCNEEHSAAVSAHGPPRGEHALSRAHGPHGSGTRVRRRRHPPDRHLKWNLRCRVADVAPFHRLTGASCDEEDTHVK